MGRALRGRQRGGRCRPRPPARRRDGNNIKGGSWRLREHQALTQPLAQLNGPPESPHKQRRQPDLGARPQTRLSMSRRRFSMSTDTCAHGSTVRGHIRWTTIRNPPIGPAAPGGPPASRCRSGSGSSEPAEVLERAGVRQGTPTGLVAADAMEPPRRCRQAHDEAHPPRPSEAVVRPARLGRYEPSGSRTKYSTERPVSATAVSLNQVGVPYQRTSAVVLQWCSARWVNQSTSTRFQG